MKTYLIVALTLVVQVTFAQIRVNVPNGNSRDKKEKHEETSSSDCDFQKGEKVEVYDPIEKKWFASDILKTETNQWYIHYEGYDSKWDTWAKCDFIRRIGTTKAIPSTNSQTQNESQSISSSQSVPIIPTVIPGQKTTLCIGDPIIYTDESTNSKVKLFCLPFRAD